MTVVDVNVAELTLIHVGEDWLWLAQEIEAVLPGDEEMGFVRIHSDVSGGQCIEVMTAVQDPTQFERMAKDGFAAEVPRVGVIRIPAHYFEGLLTAFGEAKVEYGIE